MVLSFSMLFSFSPASYNNVPKTFPKVFFKNIQKDFLKVVCILFATSALLFLYLEGPSRKIGIAGGSGGLFF